MTPLRHRLHLPSRETLLVAVGLLLLIAFLVVLLVQPSAVGRGGR